MKALHPLKYEIDRNLLPFELIGETLTTHNVSKELPAIESRILCPIKFLIKVLRQEYHFGTAVN
jgi:hypothetical protein